MKDPTAFVEPGEERGAAGSSANYEALVVASAVPAKRHRWGRTKEAASAAAAAAVASFNAAAVAAVVAENTERPPASSPPSSSAAASSAAAAAPAAAPGVVAAAASWPRAQKAAAPPAAAGGAAASGAATVTFGCLTAEEAAAASRQPPAKKADAASVAGGAAGVPERAKANPASALKALAKAVAASVAAGGAGVPESEKAAPAKPAEWKALPQLEPDEEEAAEGAEDTDAVAGEIPRWRPTRQAAIDLVHAYGAAWEAQDATAAGLLFAKDAVYSERPFAAELAVFCGREQIEDYWRQQICGKQRRVRFRQRDEQLLLDAERCRCVAKWEVVFETNTGRAGGVVFAPVRMAQVAILDLQEPPEGSGSTLPQIASLEEYWHSEQVDSYDECTRWIEREPGDEPQDEVAPCAEAAALLAGGVPGAQPSQAPLAGLGVHGGLQFIDWDDCWDYARGHCRHGDRCQWRHDKGPDKPAQPAQAEDAGPPGEEDVDETDHGIDAFDDPEAVAAEADEPLSGAAAEMADAMRGQKAAQLLRAKLRDGEFEGYEAWETALDIQEKQLADQEARLRAANKARLQAEAKRREATKAAKERQEEQEALTLQSKREAAEVEEAKRQHEIRMSQAAKDAEARKKVAEDQREEEVRQLEEAKRQHEARAQQLEESKKLVEARAARKLQEAKGADEAMVAETAKAELLRERLEKAKGRIAGEKRAAAGNQEAEAAPDAGDPAAKRARV